MFFIKKSSVNETSNITQIIEYNPVTVSRSRKNTISDNFTTSDNIDKPSPEIAKQHLAIDKTEEIEIKKSTIANVLSKNTISSKNGQQPNIDKPSPEIAKQHLAIDKTEEVEIKKSTIANIVSKNMQMHKNGQQPNIDKPSPEIAKQHLAIDKITEYLKRFE